MKQLPVMLIVIPRRNINSRVLFKRRHFKPTDGPGSIEVHREKQLSDRSGAGFQMNDHKLTVSPEKQKEEVKTAEKNCHKPYVDVSPETEPPRAARRHKYSTPSYIAAISQAILSSPMKRLPLAEIYQFIERHHPEFKEGRPRWKNTVRHNLSLHECFVKGEMTANQKCCYWKIHPRYAARFSRGDFSRRPADRCHREHFATASYPDPDSSDIGRDAAVGFCRWVSSPYSLATPQRSLHEWYRPMFLHNHPTCPTRVFPAPSGGSPLLYLDGVWGKSKQLHSYEGARLTLWRAHRNWLWLSRRSIIS